MTATKFDTSEYTRSHIKPPRGMGSWAFSAAPDSPIEDVKFSPNLTYADAKKWARDEFPKGSTIYVQP